MEERSSGMISFEMMMVVVVLLLPRL